MLLIFASFYFLDKCPLICIKTHNNKTFIKFKERFPNWFNTSIYNAIDQLQPDGCELSVLLAFHISNTPIFVLVI